MKKIIFILSLLFLFSCSSLVNRNGIYKINIAVGAEVYNARIDDYPLLNGNNYLKVKQGSHYLFWTEKNKDHSRIIEVNRNSKSFGIY